MTLSRMTVWLYLAAMFLLAGCVFYSTHVVLKSQSELRLVFRDCATWRPSAD